MTLNFRTFGDTGEPLLILHGLFGSLDNWLTVSRRLSSQFRVFAVDQRNHGNSPHVAEMSYEALAADIVEFLRQRGLESAHLLGHSMGGKAAMEAALRYPTAVRKLIVVDIAPRAYPAQHKDILDALLGLKLGALKNRREAEDALASQIPDIGVRRFLLKNISLKTDGRLAWKMNLAAIASNYQRLISGLRTGRSFAGPALFLRGQDSDYIQPQDEALIRRLFPASQIRSVPGAGHWVHAEATEVLVGEVRRFLSSTL